MKALKGKSDEYRSAIAWALQWLTYAMFHHGLTAAFIEYQQPVYSKNGNAENRNCQNNAVIHCKFAVLVSLAAIRGPVRDSLAWDVIKASQWGGVHAVRRQKDFERLAIVPGQQVEGQRASRSPSFNRP